MTNFELWNQKFGELKCCVLIPTYNNEKTLQIVIDGVLNFTNHIIIINDGSTDSTKNCLEENYPNVQKINIEPNKGKGNALREGFKNALSLGFEYAISIDSDAQHYPEDLPLFLKEIENNPTQLLIGSRNMDQENIPGKSSFGNKFSNFWFHLFTGIKLTDTQSGYRLYPIKALEKVKYFTNRFEFEVEVIVKAAWKGIPVKNIPIKVHYQKPGERVSHFRPFQDFSRISLLNTYFFILAFLYYIPLRFLLKINKKSIRKFIKDNFFNPEIPVSTKALSIGFGVFMGIFPIWGYQLLVGIPLAHFLKLNKALFITAANISFPPMIPLIIFLSFRLGYYFVQDGQTQLIFNQDLDLNSIKENFIQYIIGAILLAFIAGMFSSLISFFYLKIYRWLKTEGLLSKNQNS